MGKLQQLQNDKYALEQQIAVSLFTKQFEYILIG